MRRYNSQTNIEESSLTRPQKVLIATRLECQQQMEEIKLRINNIELSGYDMKRLRNATQTIRELAEQSGRNIGPLIDEIKAAFSPDHTQEIKARLTKEYNQMERLMNAVARTPEQPWSQDSVVEVDMNELTINTIPEEEVDKVVLGVESELNEKMGKNVMSSKMVRKKDAHTAIIHVNSSYKTEAKSALIQLWAAMREKYERVVGHRDPDMRPMKYKSGNVVHSPVDIHRLELAQVTPLIIPENPESRAYLKEWHDSAFGGLLHGVHCGKDASGCEKAARVSIEQMISNDPSISVEVKMNIQSLLNPEPDEPENSMKHSR